MIDQEPDTAEGAARETAGLNGAQWRLIRHPALTGAENMAIDTALLLHACRGEGRPAVRFYEWHPAALSFGRHQRATEKTLSVARERGWDPIRRPTGGRGVLHQHEVTYSVVLPPDLASSLSTREIYRFIAHLLQDGLSRLGLVLEPAAGPGIARSLESANCFALLGIPDLSTVEGKCVGSAQVRSGGAVLQHGSVLLEADHESWRAAWGEAGRLAPLNLLAGRPVRRDEVEVELVNGLRAWARSVDDSVLSGAEEATVTDLVELMRRHPLEWTREVFGPAAASWGAEGERRDA